jgi:hypothetical protein
MVSTIRSIAKVVIVGAVLVASLHVAAALENLQIAYISPTGSDGNQCSAASPCASFSGAAFAVVTTGGQVGCLGGASSQDALVLGSPTNYKITIDCAGGVWTAGQESYSIAIDGSNELLILRHLTFNAGAPIIQVNGSGTLIIDDCTFQYGSTALDIEPNGLLNLVIKNSRISNNTAGILLKPASGGTVRATLDHVTITNNAGGGLKADSTSGVVTLDVSDSEISDNAGNGINLVGGATDQNLLNLTRTVMAKNGAAGLQASGANAGALVDVTLFDTNASGATTVLNSAHVLSYGNNRIVGTSGSGFTGPAALQ